jgi:hypothetical protein
MLSEAQQSVGTDLAEGILRATIADRDNSDEVQHLSHCRSKSMFTVLFTSSDKFRVDTLPEQKKMTTGYSQDGLITFLASLCQTQGKIHRGRFVS